MKRTLTKQASALFLALSLVVSSSAVYGLNGYEYLDQVQKSAQQLEAMGMKFTPKGNSISLGGLEMDEELESINLFLTCFDRPGRDQTGVFQDVSFTKQDGNREAVYYFYRITGVWGHWNGGRFTVGLVESASPGMLAGIKEGDIITGIKELSSMGSLTAQLGVLKISSPGTLTVQATRGGSALTFPVKIINTCTENLQYRIDGPGIGYIAIDGIEKGSSEELKAALDILRKQGMKSLILDLRADIILEKEEFEKTGELLLPKGALLYKATVNGVQKEYRIQQGAGTLPVTVLVSGSYRGGANVLAHGLSYAGAQIITDTYPEDTVEAVERAIPCQEPNGTFWVVDGYYNSVVGGSQGVKLKDNCVLLSNEDDFSQDHPGDQYFTVPSENPEGVFRYHFFKNVSTPEGTADILLELARHLTK